MILEQMSLNTIQGLSIQMSYDLHIHSLPQHHRDPFDHMLVAQCQVEGLPILTADPQIAQYDVDVVW